MAIGPANCRGCWLLEQADRVGSASAVGATWVRCRIERAWRQAAMGKRHAGPAPQPAPPKVAKDADDGRRIATQEDRDHDPEGTINRPAEGPTPSGRCALITMAIAPSILRFPSE